MNDNKSCSTTKKRKASDGRATVDGSHDMNTGNTNHAGSILSSWFGYFSGQRDSASSGFPNNEQLIQQSLSKIDRMEQIMIRMDEKLATVSSLESRCEQLEAKCSSLENILESTSQSTKEHMNRLETKVDSVHVKLDRSLNFHEYNKMLVKNQRWEYSADVDTHDNLVSNGYTDDEAEYVVQTAAVLRDTSLQLRRGLFPDEDADNFDKGISMGMPDDDPIFSEAANDELLPHWKEFAAALKQFTPAMNLLSDNSEGYFRFYFVQLNHEAMMLIKEALIGKPFQRLTFINNDNGDADVPVGMSVNAILDIVESNKHLRKLEIWKNWIGNQHIERLCSAVHTHAALVALDLGESFEPSIGDEMLAALLTSGVLMLEKLDMSSNNITSAVSTLLADFLATNPRLKELNLGGNNLNDSDAALIATALRSNTTLRYLHLHGNEITNVGEESLRLVLYDESSLNSAADSNHRCNIRLIDIFIVVGYIGNNSHSRGQINRAAKVYKLLSIRNQSMSNVKHFGNIDVKILPNMLEAMQRYHNAASVHNANAHLFRRNFDVEPVSIVYETLRKWDKVMELCKSLGAENMSIND
ncbi:leucine-rich repeat protein [Skeletonema marinoi]|uniref:Leucine-rich repeat protein n=1 Tax=Skeletonema marinoi TaxID=267567 RepID=A0AAD9D9D4_9STRA|nr:leucine-rich repeat protein [Skeletonema marinoi]